MMRLTVTLDAIEHDPAMIIHSEDLIALDVEACGLITIKSRIGKITVYARAARGFNLAICLWFSFIFITSPVPS
jgi:hypothetical protein